MEREEGGGEGGTNGGKGKREEEKGEKKGEGKEEEEFLLHTWHVFGVKRSRWLFKEGAKIVYILVFLIGISGLVFLLIFFLFIVDTCSFF